jgi:calreticulin
MMSKCAVYLSFIMSVLAAIAALTNAKVFYNEDFSSDNLDKWIASTAKDNFGKLVLTAGDFFGDAKINKGAKTSQDAHFYAQSSSLGAPISNEGKTIVVSISVKHEQGIDCGGGYVKLMPKLEQTAFNGESEYWLMFGPDKCGGTNKVHVIFHYNGKNLLWKKEPRFPDDKFTHVYTLIVRADNTYELQVDQEKKESGKLEDDWEFLEPKEVDDESDKKPADWVDEAEMDDPSDSKPADWDNEPEQVVDAEAKKPDDWDDAEDGAWEAPLIPNPKFKGAWAPKKIANPAYKGVWRPKKIANPKYVADDKLYLIRKPIEFVGIDVWQVKAGTIFDNIVIGDDLDEVNKIIDATWGATKDAEKKALEAKDAAAKAQAETEKPATPAEDEKEDL